MNRRDLFKGIAAMAGGLLLPPTLAENAETATRYWALGVIREPMWVVTDITDGRRREPVFFHFEDWGSPHYGDETRATLWRRTQRYAADGVRR